MAEFNILDHLDALEPDGGKTVAGDASYRCPVCNAKNFKVNLETGKWGTFSCDCANTESGKRKVRAAICPPENPNPKPARPKQDRHWDYFTPKTLEAGKPALRVHRIDDGNGGRKIWQESLVGIKVRPAEIAAKVLPYGYSEAIAALEAGAPFILWVEGEPCVDALRNIGIPAVTSIGGAGKFKPERDAGLFPPDRLVVCPDRDQPGLKHADAIASAYIGCQWLYPFPGTPQWNGSCPPDKGLDIADWIAQGATAEQIINSIGPKREAVAEPSGEAESEAHQDPIDEWEATLKTLVDPTHHCFEKNIIRRQIRAATAASELNLRVSPDQIRARLIQKQRELLAGTEAKGVEGGAVAKFAQKRWLISNLIAEGCLTGIAAFAKVGKTKALTELAAALVFQQPFMGNPDWQPAPGPHKLILWWTDQPGTDSAAYLMARGLMDRDGTLHPQILKLYTQEDNLCWDDQGLDELITVTTANPDAVLLTDSFYANVQPIYGSDQAPESGGALIDVQTFASRYTKAHICAFHSPQETGPVGVAAMRGHGSAKGVVSSTISLHFLEHKCPSGSGKWVADKENPHRRMVTEGRLPYTDLLVKLDGAAGTWTVIGKFQQALAELQSDDRKGEVVDSLTTGQRETLEWVGAAIGVWKDPSGVTAHQVAVCKVQHLNRQPTRSEVEQTRTQLRALVKKQLLSETQKGSVTKYSYRS
jgi:hypothetical protein